MSSPKTDEQLLAELRRDCKANLYLFAKTVCGFDKFVPTLHKDMCDFLQYNDSLRKMLLCPRDHYKSSAIQAFILWRLVRNPEERILIAGDTAKTAQAKLLKIKQILEGNQTLRALYPEIIPLDTSKVQWSTEALTIKRKRAASEASLTAQGVEGARAGAHYTLIVCDDIATKEAKDQPSTMAKIIDWMDGTEALLEEAYKNQIIVVGTPWSHDDVYEHVRKSWTHSHIKTFYSEMVRPFFDDDEEPIFPELYGGRDNAIDFATRLSRTNPYLWSANFMLSPQIPDAEFKESDLQYYQYTPDGRYLLYRDDRDETRVQPVAALEIYIACDPAFTKDATASKAAINVSGVAPDGNIFILESIGMRGGTDALIDRIVGMVIRFGDQLRKVGVEKVGQQQSFIDYLNREFRRRGIYRRVEPLPPGSAKSKEVRIRSQLQPYFSQKRVYLRVGMSGLLDEFRKFPLSNVRDELDAMAYGAQYFWGQAANAPVSSYEDYMRQYNADRRTASATSGY